MHKLYTLSYSGLDVVDLDTWTQHLGAILLDIRFKPFSRDKRYGRDHLKHLLGDRYFHFPQLGNANYKGDTVHIHKPSEGYPRLAKGLEGQSFILLCVCWNVEECHRKVVSDHMVDEYGVEVEHLKGRYEPPPECEQMALL